MRLTPKQLRAIFAKLGRVRSRLMGPGPKNLGLKPPPGGSLLRSLGSRSQDLGITPAFVTKLKRRLPAHHAQYSKINEVLIGEGKALKARMIEDGYSRLERLSAAGGYNMRTRNIMLNTHSRSRLAGYMSGYTRFTAARALGRTRRRQAKMDVAATYYHEYAHSMDLHQDFSFSPQWTDIARKEWRPTTSMGVNVSPSIEMEFWADAYASYALSKSSRMRLHRERPLTYGYMSRFFSAGPKRTGLFGWEV